MMAFILSQYVKSQWCQSHVGDISVFPVGKPVRLSPHAVTIDSSLCLESLSTTGIFLILCIPNMDCHRFLKAHESPYGGASTRPTSPCHHPMDAALPLGSAGTVSPGVG